MNIFKEATSALLEFAYPERCGLCGIDRGDATWTQRGETVWGMRWWDRAQLCRGCLDMIRAEGPRSEEVSGAELPVWAATMTGPSLVRVVGLLKYHGLRGLAWPLAELMTDVLADRDTTLDLVPVALHSRRRRERGFNQAGLLARLVASRLGLTLAPKILKRSRATAQQARIAGDDARQLNLDGAFAARPPEPGEGGRPLLLVDDLVTSGATVRSAARVLRAAGWPVAGVLALGLAAGQRGDAGPVDTVDGGF